jgi:hypothetical protein
MAEIVNLKRAKKAKARADAEKTADANRAKHGTPKQLRKIAATESGRAIKALESHRLEQPSKEIEGQKR